jgi:hypothetical protein
LLDDKKIRIQEAQKHMDPRIRIRNTAGKIKEVSSVVIHTGFHAESGSNIQVNTDPDLDPGF